MTSAHPDDAQEAARRADKQCLSSCEQGGERKRRNLWELNPSPNAFEVPADSRDEIVDLCKAMSSGIDHYTSLITIL